MIQAVILGASAIICLGVIITLVNRERANTHPCSPHPSGYSGSPRHIYSNKQVRQRQIASKPEECVICFDMQPDVVIYPCDHQILCEPCITRLISESKKSCPVCRGNIKGYHVIEERAY